MARELGSIATLQAAEIIHTTENVTMGFDATTQEGKHINCIHFTTKDSCICATVDELPGGTAEDYANHICQTVDELAKTYVYFNEGTFQDIRSGIIKNISNTMTDRCAANHAALRQVSETWDKTFNELNCHLHPLDTVASSCRTALKRVESADGSCEA